MEGLRQPKLSRLEAGAVAALGFVILAPLLWILFSAVIFFGVSGSEHFRTGFAVTGALAAISACLLTRLIYARLRWHKLANDRSSYQLLTGGDRALAIAKFAILWFVLCMLTTAGIRLLGLPVSSTLGQIGTRLLPPLLSAANAFLFLKGQIRIRIAAEQAQQVAAALRCPCGYNLTGNTSGVCPECGRAIRLKAGGNTHECTAQ